MYGKDLSTSGEFICKCKHCGHLYDLYIAVAASKRKNIRTVKCTNCKKKVAIAS